MEKVRWGILGVAGINNRILPSFPRSRNAELRAIASRSLDKAKAAAKAAGIPAAHGSYEALLDDPSIDAVYIPLPNSLHAEWTRKAAERGKHIWCEKPLCPTAAEAQALVDFCKAKGVKLMEGFMWPHHPRTQHLRRFLESGGIGEIRRVGGAFTFQMLPLDPNNIRLKPELAGGSLLDVGCYPVYGIRWAFGAEPAKAYATATYHNGVDVEMNGILWLADGRTATFDCGFTHPFRRWLEITGTEAVVWVPQMWIPLAHANYYVYREGKPVEEVVIEDEDQIQHMIENFSRAALENQPLTPPPEEAVKTLRVLDALAKSAREGRVVAVES